LGKQQRELYANNGKETEIQDTESKLTQLREKQIKGIMTRVKAKCKHQSGQDLPLTRVFFAVPSGCFYSHTSRCQFHI
jgi:hypothetical protein